MSGAKAKRNQDALGTQRAPQTLPSVLIYTATSISWNISKT